MRVVFFAILFVILLAGMAVAECPEPDIAVYTACGDKCPDPVSYTEDYADCINDCLAMWNRIQEEHSACLKAEWEAAEKKQEEADRKMRQEEEKKLTVSNLEGALWLTHPDGLTEHIVPGDLISRARPGDNFRIGPKSHVDVTLPDGNVIMAGPDTDFDYVDGEIMDVLDVWIVRYDFLKGTVRFYPHRDKKSRVVVKTPHATVSHKKTEFIVQVDPVLNMTAVLVYDGVVDVNTTKGETFELNANEMMTIDSGLNAVRIALNPDDWNGLVDSVTTGANFTPSYLAQEEELELVEEEIQTIEEDTGKVMILILVMAAVLMVLIGVIIARRKKGN